MRVIESVIGDARSPEFAGRIHHLEHHHGVDVVQIETADLPRRRLRTTTESGEEIAIALPREQTLFDGAILALDHHRAILVKVPSEQWLRLEPVSRAAAIEAGYHAGNLHWKVRFGGDVLFVALTGDVDDYTARIRPMIDSGLVSWSVVERADMP